MKIRKVVLIGVFGLLSLNANASSITGTIELTGSWTPIDNVASPTTIDVATGIDFTNDQSFVVDSSGDLSMPDLTQAVPVLTLATMSDFQFSPLSPNPVSVWSVGGFTFSMDNVTINTQDSVNLSLSGSGTVTGGGFDPTPGTWEFTGQTASDITFSWSSSNFAVVPVPAALWLFGSGLIGLVAVSRRKQS